ncbi:MAG: redoxin domain-containing protein [Planctomycetota bacterium]|nr:redoxin domain-containing protein [Planctomycetota bacterium]
MSTMVFARSILLLACAGTPAFAGEIRGRVLDAAGAPVAKARVIAAENTVAHITYASPQSVYAISPSEADVRIAGAGKLTGDTTTDAEGRFTLRDLRTARYTLLAFEAQLGFVTHFDTDVGGEFDLTLKSSATVSGRVKGLELDRTKHVLQLKLRAPFHNLVFAPNVDWIGADEFRFGPLPDVPGWNLVLTEWVIERGYSGVVALQPVDAVSGANAAVAIDSSAGRIVTGSVRTTEAGALANVSIVARSNSTPVRERGGISGKDGRFRLIGLEDGEWTIEARRFTTRETAGCGVGPKDVFAASTVRVGADAVGEVSFVVPRLLNALRVGDVAPAFKALTLAGAEISLADLRGKAVLVDFWATWCSMCRAEFPKLRDTYAMFAGGTRFEIVGVSIDEDLDAVRKLTQRLGLTWPQTALGPVEKNALAQLFNIAATPSSFLIDREGKIVAINALGDELRTEIAKLLPPK